MQKITLLGLGVLVLLICTVFVFMTVRNLAEIRQLKEETAVVEKLLEDSNKPKPVEKADEQPPAEQGFKWVWHNDHWDKVPVAQTDDAPHVTPVDIHEQARLKRQAEARAEADKFNAAMAAAKTARERNQLIMQQMENSPYFELQIDHYNFLKEHPDFSTATASPELHAKWRAAVRAKYDKMRAFSDEITADMEKLGGTTMDRAPKNPKPIGLDDGGGDQ
ncbi:MAG: hypothetical protein OXI43_23275 [Candidatus Poribacteria bacterium]|nr:hypothetical protein [Candidatus Poribacteria bacterium]